MKSRAAAIFGLVLLTLASIVPNAAAGPATASTLRQLDTRHYSIHTDLDRALAEDLAKRLDVMYDEYARRLADFDRPEEQEEILQVYLFRRHEDYQSFVQNRAPNTGGVFLPERKMLVAYYEGQGRDALRRTLQHEAFHQFAHARISEKLPPWLNEGLATLFEEGIWTGKGFELGEVPPRRVRQLRADQTGKRLTSFGQFMAMDLDNWNNALVREPGLAAAQYNQAWAMVHFLVFSMEKDQFKYRKRFIDMLRLIHDGAETRAAFEQSLSKNIDGFESRFREYIPTLRPTQRATLIERQEVLGDMLIELKRMGKRYQRIDDFRKDLADNGYRLKYSKGEVRWTSESDPDVYFSAPSGGRLLREDELFFESRSQAPMPDMVYRGPGMLRLRMRFYDIGDVVHREVLVEGAG